MAAKGSTIARRAAAAALLSTSVGIAAWLSWPEPPPLPPPPPRLVVAGTRLDVSADPVAEAMDVVRRYAQAPLKLVLPDGTSRELRAAVLGLEIDRVRLAELVNAAVAKDSALRRAYDQRRAHDATATLSLPVPLGIDGARAIDTLVSIKDEIDKPAKDAVLNLQTRRLEKEHMGYRLDVYGTLARIDAALRAGKREVEAAADRIKPRVVASELGNVEFDHVLGYFATRYSTSARARARTYNLRLAASKLDGTVLLPGEVFDFNETVGPRDEAHGYKVAPVIAEGELIDGIGGGTCQISGTLHGAAFFGGLEILERTPHTRPSTYIKLGLDAAVAYPTINLKLRNNFDFPIVLHETVKSGRVTAQVLGPTRKRTVTFFRRIDEVIAFDEVERPSDKLEEGVRELSQRGVPGFKATVVRVVREGAYAWRDKRQSRYPPTTQIISVGTGKKGDDKPDHDSHPEYNADEYLVVTQGPAIRGREAQVGGGTVEARTPGRYGRVGWQAELGMKVFKPRED